MSRTNVEKRLANHRRRLQKLQERQAMYGADTPAHILIEIEDTKAIIADLNAELGQLVEDQADDAVRDTMKSAGSQTASVNVNIGGSVGPGAVVGGVSKLKAGKLRDPQSIC